MWYLASDLLTFICKIDPQLPLHRTVKSEPLRTGSWVAGKQDGDIFAILEAWTQMFSVCLISGWDLEPTECSTHTRTFCYQPGAG